MSRPSKKRVTRANTNSDDEIRKELEENLRKSKINFRPVYSPSAENNFFKDTTESTPNTSGINISVKDSDIESDQTLTDSLVRDETLGVQPLPNDKMANNENSSRIVVMNQQITYKDALTLVPEFDGYNIRLSQFLEGCNEARDLIGPAGEANLVKLIKSKLTGEARASVTGETFTTVEALKTHLKSIYSPSKIVQQLLGEIGYEFQRNNESVISFANRIKEIGERILEAQRVFAGNVHPEFQTSTETTLVECFKRGLKPEINQRMGEDQNRTNMIKNAIRIERELEAQNSIRNKFSGETRFPKKNTYACTICHSETHESTACSKQTITQATKICHFCKKPGHFIAQCPDKNRNFVSPSSSSIVCQLCQKVGHVAKQCFTISKCQICNQIGHNSKFCRNRSNNISCQICNQTGHVAKTCPRINSFNKTQMETRSLINCQLCGKTGHTATTCYSKQNLSVPSNNELFCNYCKNVGHTINTCQKRINNNARAQGNEQSLPVRSAPLETQPKARATFKETNATSMDDLLCELIPTV